MCSRRQDPALGECLPLAPWSTCDPLWTDKKEATGNEMFLPQLWEQKRAQKVSGRFNALLSAKQWVERREESGEETSCPLLSGDFSPAYPSCLSHPEGQQPKQLWKREVRILLTGVLGPCSSKGYSPEESEKGQENWERLDNHSDLPGCSSAISEGKQHKCKAYAPALYSVVFNFTCKMFVSEHACYVLHSPIYSPTLPIIVTSHS